MKIRNCNFYGEKYFIKKCDVGDTIACISFSSIEKYTPLCSLIEINLEINLEAELNNNFYIRSKVLLTEKKYFKRGVPGHVFAKKVLIDNNR